MQFMIKAGMTRADELAEKAREVLRRKGRGVVERMVWTGEVEGNAQVVINDDVAQEDLTAISKEMANNNEWNELRGVAQAGERHLACVAARKALADMESAVKGAVFNGIVNAALALLKPALATDRAALEWSQENSGTAESEKIAYATAHRLLGPSPQHMAQVTRLEKEISELRAKVRAHEDKPAPLSADPDENRRLTFAVGIVDLAGMTQEQVREAIYRSASGSDSPEEVSAAVEAWHDAAQALDTAVSCPISIQPGQSDD